MGAAIVTDGTGNPFGTSDLLSNYPSFMGCPTAGTRNIGKGAGSTICGDIAMSLILPAGKYTILLSDAGYIPNAVFDNGTLAEGFTDLTNGIFATCNTTVDGTTCATDIPRWAFDVTTSPVTTPTPEPGTLLLFGSALSAVAARRRFRRRFRRQQLHTVQPCSLARSARIKFI
jgi:hypothetical protein